MLVRGLEIRLELEAAEQLLKSLGPGASGPEEGHKRLNQRCQFHGK